MRSGSLFAAFGAASSFPLLLLSLLYLLAGAYVYISLIHQISARSSATTDARGRSFGLPEAIVAGLLSFFLLLNIGTSVSNPSALFTPRNLAAILLVTSLLLMFVVLF